MPAIDPDRVRESQEAVLQSKPVVIALIEEIEKLKPLVADAVKEEKNQLRSEVVEAAVSRAKPAPAPVEKIVTVHKPASEEEIMAKASERMRTLVEFMYFSQVNL